MDYQKTQDPNPLLTCKFSDQDLNFKGYIVIDSAVGGRCCGGIRLSPEVTLYETMYLAKNMTLKYGFLGIPLGGAKAGICIEEVLSKTKRKKVFNKIGKILSPLVANGAYIPGPDMGTSDRDIDWLLDAANNEKKEHEHAPTSLYTSWTMLSSALEALRHLKLNIKNSTVVIEGFGKIGESVAKILTEKGAKVIAVSTLKGGIFNLKGLDVPRLSKIKTKYGDEVVNHYPDATKITNEELLCLSADVLLPCAGPWTIDLKNAHKIKAKIICPGANIPIARDAEKILFDKKIICLPDFVTNSGGVLGSYMGSLLSEQDKKNIIEKIFSKRVEQVIEISEDKGVPYIEIAKKIAIKRFNKTKNKFEKSNTKNQIKNKIKVMIPRVYQNIFVRPKAKKMFSQILSSTEQPF